MSVVIRLSLVTLLVASCIGESYSVAVRNATDHEINDASVSFDGFHSIGGGLDPGIFKINADVRKRIPAQAIVEWRTPDQVVHRQIVQVNSVVPRNFRDMIFFDIMPDGSVRVVPRTELPPIPSTGS